MNYKIVEVVVPHETSSVASMRTEEATIEMETEVQTYLDAGWSLEGGAHIAATKLGHIMLIQTLTKV